MTPILLWIDALENRYWSIRGRLRGPVNDPQICGDGFCALGVLCDLYLKNGGEDVLKFKARWDGSHFVWDEDGTEQRQSNENDVPKPVMVWWKKFHAMDLAGIITFNDDLYRSFNELAMYLRGAAGLHYVTAK
jgi:hypothetical protein